MSTEAAMRNDILRVQAACVENQIMHLSHCFKDTPAPRQAAVVVRYITCPDDVATELHMRLDATWGNFLVNTGSL